MIAQIREMIFNLILDKEQMQQFLKRFFPDPSKGKNLRKRIMEAGAIAAYHQQTDYPVMSIPSIMSLGILAIWSSGIKLSKLSGNKNC
jgi:hypothetical protein